MKRLFLIGMAVLGAWQWVGAIQTGLSIQSLKYEDGSERKIHYDFSSGSITWMDGWQEIQIPESAISNRASGESSTTFLWGEYGWGTNTAADLFGGELSLAVEQARHRYEEFEGGWALGTYGYVTNASDHWDFELRLADFFGTDKDQHSLEFSIGGGGWDAGYAPAIWGAWFTGWHDGSYYTNVLVLGAGVENEKVGYEESSADVILTGYNPSSTILDLRVEVRSGTRFEAKYQVNGSGWNQIWFHQIPSGSMPGFPGLMPYFDIESSNGSEPSALVEVKQFVESDPLDRSILTNAAQKFQADVDANATNYPARVYNAAAQLVNLLNNADLLSLAEAYGFTIPTLLQEPFGKISLSNAPPSDLAVGMVYSNCLPVIDAALADLEAIPTNWSSTAEVSTNYFPVDETMYVDIGDVMMGRALLRGTRAWLQTVQAYQLDVDYDRLQCPADASQRTMIVDGYTEDWNGVPVQLSGNRGDDIHSVRAAWDDEYVYLLIEGEPSNYYYMPQNASSGSIQFELGSTLAWNFPSYYYYETNVSWSAAPGGSNEVQTVFNDGCLEVSFRIPDGVAVSNASVMVAELLYESYDEEYWDILWKGGELEYPLNVPANNLFDAHPGLLGSVQQPELLASASNDLQTAIGHLRDADSLITRRTDGQLHFVEYDAAYANDRSEFFAGLDDVEGSLVRPITVNPTNYFDSISNCPPALVGFGAVDVHLGAFFASDYLTRSMLPDYIADAQLAEPVINSFPDPTFGGILPSFTQRTLVNLYAGEPLSESGGLSAVKTFIESDPPNRALLDQAAQEFQADVDASPTDYTARVYNAAAQIANLLNNADLLSLAEAYGFTIPTLLEEPFGELSLSNAPPSDLAVGQIYSNCLPVIDAALADLEAIPANWTGTAEVSSNYFPVDETMFVDIGDVMVGKAVLKGLRSMLQTVQAYQLDVDYDRLVHPVDAAWTTIQVDGATNDWAGIEPHLLGTDEEAIHSVYAARDSSNLYVMMTFNLSSNVYYHDIDGEFRLGVDSTMDWSWAEYWGGSNVSWSADGTVSNGINLILTNSILEASFAIPETVNVTNASAVSVSMFYEDQYYWGSSELAFPDHVPVNDLLSAHPNALASVQSSALMTVASNDLSDAIGYIRQADGLIHHRADGLLHLVEYDVSYTNERTQFFAGLDDFERSLNKPIDFAPSDYDPAETNFAGTRIHLGAFYQAPYLTRAMLPDYEDLALITDAPILNSYPDPTFGGVFPGVTQRHLANLQVGLPFDLMLNAPQAVTISTEQWPSKIQMDWGAIDGADSYEIYRSLTDDFNDAQLLGTTSGASYTDSGLEKETTYYYWVRAVNVAGPGEVNETAFAGRTSAAFAMPWLNLLLE